jgi:hypothetical protein
MSTMEQILNSVVSGLITGAFSAGAVYGVLKTEMKWMRRDLDEDRASIKSLWGALRDMGSPGRR